MVAGDLVLAPIPWTCVSCNSSYRILRKPTHIIVYLSFALVSVGHEALANVTVRAFEKGALIMTLLCEICRFGFLYSSIFAGVFL